MSSVKLGAEPKKVAILVALLGLGGYLLYTNLGFGIDDGGGSTGAGSSSSSRSTPLKNLVTEAMPSGSPDAAPAFTRGRQQQRQGDFRPSLRPRKPEERLDPMTADPTLRTELLDKLAQVKVEGIQRSLFDISAEPVTAKQPEPNIVVQQQTAKKMVGPEPPPPPPPDPPKPKAPPVPLKFYGYQVARSVGLRRTFCMDGDEILTPSEGETVKGRYKIVRIGLTSVVVEDLQFKQQQTLPIEEAGQGL